MSLPSLFEGVELPKVLGGDVPKSLDVRDLDLEDYLVDLRNWGKLRDLPNVKYEEFSRESLAQKPGMEWLSTADMVLLAPQSEDVGEQEKYLESFLDQLRVNAERITVGDCPTQYPEGFDEPLIALDTETTGLDQRLKYKYDEEDGLLHIDPQTRLVGLCLAVSGVQGFYLPVGHNGRDGVLNWNYGAICGFISRINETFVTIIHNTQYDREVMAQNDIRMRPFPYFIDTQILHYLSDVNQKRHGLKLASKELLGQTMIEIRELFGEREDVRFEQLAAKQAYVYAGSDATQTFSLYKKLVGLPTNPMKVQPIPFAIDHKVSDTLRQTYRTGAPVDVKWCVRVAMDTLKQVRMIEEYINEMAGRKVAINSPMELSKLLFDEFKVPPLPGMEKGRAGYYSTGEEELERLEEAYPQYSMLRYVVQFRKLNNQLSKFLSKGILNTWTCDLLPYMRTGFSFSQTNVPTGRFSSSSSGSLDKAILSIGKMKVSYSIKKGDGTCGFNSQGMSSPKNWPSGTRKIKKLSDKYKDFYGPGNMYTKDEREDLIRFIATQKK